MTCTSTVACMDMESTESDDMRRVAKKAYYRVRALVLIPAMIILGLALVIYDRLRRRPR